MPKQKIDLQKREFVFNLIKTLSQPSLGCTEIGLIALAATIASEILKGKISKANVKISPYIYRNVAHIGVPLLGFCGVNMIAASGFIIKNSRSGLALLCDLNPSKITQVKSLSKRISHDIVNDVDPVFCAINATDSLGNNAQVVIEKYHDNVTSIILNNKKIKIPSKFQQQEQTTSQSNLQYAPEDITLSDLITIVDSFSLSELSFLKKGVSLNDAIARYGIKHNSKNGLTSAFINSIPALKQHS
jgi:L-cysteine desulfidase